MNQTEIKIEQQSTCEGDAPAMSANDETTNSDQNFGVEAILPNEAVQPNQTSENLASKTASSTNQASQKTESRKKFRGTLYAANSGITDACLAVGEMFRAGIGTQKNVWEAIVYWHRSLPPNAQHVRGHEQSRWFAVLGRSDSLSWQWETPNSLRCVLHSIASYYRQLDPPIDSAPRIEQQIQWGYLAAVTCYEILVQHGDVEATHELGLMCLQGKGMPINLTRGMKLLHRALRAKHPDAYVILGNGYLFGNFGIPKDPPRGRQLLRTALKKGIEFPEYESINLEEPEVSLENTIGSQSVEDSSNPVEAEKALEAALLEIQQDVKQENLKS